MNYSHSDFKRVQRTAGIHGPKPVVLGPSEIVLVLKPGQAQRTIWTRSFQDQKYFSNVWPNQNQKCNLLTNSNRAVRESLMHRLHWYSVLKLRTSHTAKPVVLFMIWNNPLRKIKIYFFSSDTMIPDLFNLIKWLLIGNNPNWSYPPSIPPSASHNYITILVSILTSV